MLAGGTLPRTSLTIPRPALLSASAGREPVVAVRAAELAYAGTAVLDGLDITVRRHVIIACGIVIAQQLTGLNAYLFYAGPTLTKYGFEDHEQINVYFNFFMMN